MNSINRQKSYFTINKGERQVITVDMAVIAGSCVAGVIVVCNENYSLAMSLLNLDFRLSSRIKSNGYCGSLGWDGSDTITGGQGDDIILGDRGRVDYLDESGDNIEVVTRLGSAPDDITGVVQSASETTLTVDQSLPTEDEGLRGLVVWINEGTGAGQSRLIVSNTLSVLTIDEAWSVQPDTTSSFRIT